VLSMTVLSMTVLSMTVLSMTVLPLVDHSMGQAKSRFVDVLCPRPSGGRDSRSSADQSFDGFGCPEDDDDDDEVELAASCCRIGSPRGGGYSSAASDDVGLADTQMVVLRDPDGGSSRPAAGSGDGPRDEVGHDSAAPSRRARVARRRLRRLRGPLLQRNPDPASPVWKPSRAVSGLIPGGREIRYEIRLDTKRNIYDALTT